MMMMTSHGDIILPVKKNKNKKDKTQEDKEKELLLAKSMQTLEMYKIRDDVYSLMQCSSDLGQVETFLKKRRREFEFSKSGLELPESDNHQSFKKKKSDSASHNVEVNEEKLESKAIINGSDDLYLSLVPQRVVDTRRSVTISSSGNSGVSNETFTSDRDGDGDVSTKESTPELAQKSTHSSFYSDEVIESEDKIVREPKDNLNGENNQGEKHSSARVRITPTVVHVSRPEEVEKQRTSLPIVEMEQEIMEAINENSSVIICGETGCGKTTQVPQFLYEAGFGSKHATTRSGIIGVTQPRRVAVLATAKRVAFELGLCLGKEVGFQVRHDKRVGDNCSIKFMTDGILLREVQSDFLLKRYSVLILDEAHERSVNTDILIGMLSRAIQVRQREYEAQQQWILSGETIQSCNRIYPLKLVLMSATLRVEDFLSDRRIFRNPPPVIEVHSRQHPVTIHFSKNTVIVDYIGQAYKKVLSIHKRLPPGGILVFVTGQREVEHLSQTLRRASRQIVANAARRNNEAFSSAVSEEKPPTEDNDMKEITEAFDFQGHEIARHFGSYMEEEDNGDISEDESDLSYGSSEDSDIEFFSDDNENHPLESDGNINIAEESLTPLKAAFEALSSRNNSYPNDDIKVQVGTQISEGEIRSVHIAEKSKDEQKGVVGPMKVLPLYAMLPASSQLRVFDDVKDNERLVVVATNVAETSLTIPGIKYVVDTGREKVKNYNSSNGMESYEVQWISKASASQRAGRAGRTGPGHCYRLYSSAVFSSLFPHFSAVEISKIPVDGVVLLLKSMHIDEVANFPFPTPPETNALIEAEKCLKELEALDDKGRLTRLGKAMARYPISPRHSRMLLTVIQIMRKGKSYARANLVLSYAVAAVAALSLSNPFVYNFQESENDDADESNHRGNDKIIQDKEEKSRIKKFKQTPAGDSREKFSHPTSDALTIAFTLKCFELSKSPTKFCSENGLHLKTMEELSKLRKQLLQLVFNNSSSNKNDHLQQPEEEFSWSHGTLEDVESDWRDDSDKHRLKRYEQEILGEAICAGWADRVAKQVMRGGVSSSTITDEGGDRKLSAVRYQACNVKERIYLHRSSSLSNSSEPREFLVYNELLQHNTNAKKRTYIYGATVVKETWLLKYARHLCHFSAPVSEPYYEPNSDQVLSYVTPTFGLHRWVFPQHALPDKSTDNKRVAVFACALLEGKVLPCLKDVREFMVDQPASLLKREPWRLNKRVGNLLSVLLNNRRGCGRGVIDSRAKLRVLWRENPIALLTEIRDWFRFQKDFCCTRFEELWAEMLVQVMLDAPGINAED